MRHEVRGLRGLDGLDPQQAWELVRDSAIRLDAMADPVALAAHRVAESGTLGEIRLSGLGGEVARGFYYLGRPRPRAYGDREVARLARWRMFVNESVEPGMLSPQFGGWSEEVALAAVGAALRDGGDEWFAATDDLYLRHRMQRWAGPTDVAVGTDRTIINPMLGPEFLEIVAGLRLEERSGARFLADLQCLLDPDLARIPLDGRPAPEAYSSQARPAPVRRALGAGSALARKAVQRALRRNRPPAGGQDLADKVVQHWRQHPELLGRVGALPLLSEGWVEGVLAGSVAPRPSSVALLSNLIVALEHLVAGKVESTWSRG